MYLVALNARQLKQMKSKKRDHFNRKVWGGLVLGTIGAGVLGNMASNQNFAKSAPMTDARLRRKKKLQSNLSIAGSATGLAGLSAITGTAVLRKNPKLFKVNPVNAAKTADSIKDKGYVLGSVAGGIGGVGGLNFAAIQRAEARKRTPVVKLDESTIGKSFPQYSANYVARNKGADPEGSRNKRQKAYTPALAIGGAGIIAGNKKIGTKYGKIREGKVQPKFDADYKKATKERYERGVKLDRELAIKQDAFKRARSGQTNQARHDLNSAKRAFDEYKKSPLPERKVFDTARSIKRGRTAAITAGVSLGALAGANEYHRRKGGTSYKHYFDQR